MNDLESHHGGEQARVSETATESHHVHDAVEVTPSKMVAACSWLHPHVEEALMTEKGTASSCDPVDWSLLGPDAEGKPTVRRTVRGNDGPDCDSRFVSRSERGCDVAECERNFLTWIDYGMRLVVSGAQENVNESASAKVYSFGPWRME